MNATTPAVGAVVYVATERAYYGRGRIEQLMPDGALAVRMESGARAGMLGRIARDQIADTAAAARAKVRRSIWKDA